MVVCVCVELAAGGFQFVMWWKSPIVFMVRVSALTDGCKC